jgi:DNA (cytosine-5)-methyltransferase 1
MSGRPRVGAMFAGYGGIELALHDVLGSEPAWFAEFDTAPSKILAHHYPGVPNHGDVTKIDWSQVEPVDIITGGSPCQDMSGAGKRAGMKAGTRSGLWSYMRDAINVIRPSLVVWENVRGALSADADSDMEPCTGCVGDPDDGPVLRALGRVLGDLADIGYDAAWVGLRAADVGAPHGRFRVFVLGWPAADADRLGHEWARAARDGRSGPADGGVTADRLTLLPTPAVNDMGAGKTVDAWDAWDAWTEAMQARHGNGNGHGASLSIEALRMLPTPVTQPTTVKALLPTPRATDGTKGGPNQRGSSGDLMLPSAVVKLLPTPTTTQRGPDANADARPDAGPNLHNVIAINFGQYAPAIARWEDITRPAPSPTEPTGKGNAHRLSPRFVEWMQGLPDGWVTDVPGVSRNDMLKALGNGVVPQQCAAAVRHLLGVMATAVAA